MTCKKQENTESLYFQAIATRKTNRNKKNTKKINITRELVKDPKV